MPWPWQSGSASGASGRRDDNDEKRSFLSSFSSPDKSVSWNDSLSVDRYKDPGTWATAFVLTTVLFGGIKFYRVFLRRIPSIEYIHPDKYRRRTLFGRVTSVGDGDGLHLYHTPGGRWAGWGWLRQVPVDKKALKGNTIPIRIAGIDAPEGAHFGRPAQPHSAEALHWLQLRLQGRTVRAHIYKRDQYDRVVATVYGRRFGGLLRDDVGLDMIRKGLATAYEAKTGSEFGGPDMEAKYRAAEAEARSRGLGLWGALLSEKKRKGSNNKKGGGGDGIGGWFGFGGGGGKTSASKEPFETPREYKERMRLLEKAEKGEAK